MGAVHTLVADKGRQGALELNAFERDVVEAAAAYLGDEDTAIRNVSTTLIQPGLKFRLGSLRF
jgi:hypothetical protein